MEYLSKKDTHDQRVQFMEIITKVREIVGKVGIKFGTHKLVGSAKRNMVFSSNEGYDMDYQLRLKKYPNKFSTQEIKDAFRKAFDEVRENYELEPGEDSTHVITIKKLGYNQEVVYSYDVAILDKNSIGKYMILKNEKKKSPDDYHFVELSDCADLDEKYARIKGADKWRELRLKYKSKKEKQLKFKKDDRTNSFSLLMEATNETL